MSHFTLILDRGDFIVLNKAYFHSFSPSIRCIGLPTCLNAVNYEYKRAPNHLKEASAGVRSMSVSSLKNEPMDENFLLLLTIIKVCQHLSKTFHNI